MATVADMTYACGPGVGDVAAPSCDDCTIDLDVSDSPFPFLGETYDLIKVMSLRLHPDEYGNMSNQYLKIDTPYIRRCIDIPYAFVLYS